MVSTACTGSLWIPLHISEVLIAISLFSSHMAVRILPSMFSFVILLLKALKSEVVNFSRSPSACMNSRQMINL